MKKVKKKSGVKDWDYVHTSINPADIGTREASAMKIKESKLWWRGPRVPHENPAKSRDKDCQEIEKEKAVVTLLVEFDPANSIRNLINPEKFSSLSKLLRVTAYVRRFVDRCKKKEIRTGEVTVEEIENAMKLWIKDEQGVIVKDKKFPNLKNQLSLFADGDGILRLKGRLEHSHLPYDSKHPVLLNRESWFTTLVIRNAHHKVKHMRMKSTLNEVRSRFWVCSGKLTVKSEIKGCIICKYITGKPLIGPAPPDLPDYRVSYEFAWQNIGIDYAGPVYVKDIYSTDPTMHKAYICLFTCAATRNVHIELVPNMSAPALIRCLKRFIGRRGKFHMAVSDNFKTFVGKELQQFLTSEGISWTHIFPKSPWWGAFYERLIRIVKESLKKSLGNAKLTYEELETVLIEIESVINCRPLTYLFEDEAEEALTPSHLVLGRRLISEVSKPEQSNVKQSQQSLNGRYRYLQTIIEHYWKRFSKEYLLELHQHHLNVHKGNYEELCKLLLGDVVLIKDDSFKRNAWKKGKVDQLIRGEDGNVRGAVLKVNTSGRASYIRRPVQKLIPLEVQKERIDPTAVTEILQEGTTPVISDPNPEPAVHEQDVPANTPTIVTSETTSLPDDRAIPNVSSRGRQRYQPDRYQAGV